MEKKETTKTKKKEKIKSHEIIFVLLALGLLIFLVLMMDRNNKKAHCAKAICNEDSTICYNYRLDEQGNTIKTWEGSCAKD